MTSYKRYIVLILVVLAAVFEGRAEAHDLKGAVLGTDGQMIQHFTVSVQPISDKPELIIRHRFAGGLFKLDGLSGEPYRIQITAPQFIGVRLDVDFSKKSDTTEFRVVVLHEMRNERFSPGPLRYTVSLSSMQPIPAAARKDYDHGVQLHRKGDLIGALVAYGDAFRRWPTYLQALTDAGTIYLVLDRPEAALALLKRALAVDPDNLLVRLNVAAAYISSRRPKDAIPVLEQVIRISDQKSLPRLFLARAYLTNKQPREAEREARMAVAEDPRLLDGRLLLLSIADQIGDETTVRQTLSGLRDAVGNSVFSSFVDDEISSLNTK